jgi:hypothetical protein
LQYFQLCFVVVIEKKKLKMHCLSNDLSLQKYFEELLCKEGVIRLDDE